MNDLTADVEAACEAIKADAELAPVHPVVARDRGRLDEPLRVAVSGPVSAGKSTLVNALIGRRVAVTGSGETTLANWWFRHGESNEVVVRRPGGVTETLPIADGRIPELGAVDLDREDSIEVHIDAPFLKGMTVIDTPGLFSPSSEHSERARALLRDRTTRAAGLADALIYVTDEIPGAAADDQQLREFQELFGPVSKAPTNALLILSKVDRWWAASARAERDPLAIGHSMLAAHRAELRHRVWDALPVIGLLAETVITRDVLDADDLQALAASPDRRLLALGHQMLMRARADVPPERRAALVATLGAYGLTTALEAVDAGVTPEEALWERSGFEPVRRMIDQTFRTRSELLRADALLLALERLALTRHGGLTLPAADRLRGLIEGVRAGAHARGLRALGMLREVADRKALLNADEREELRRLFSGTSAASRLGPPPDGCSPLEHALRRRDAWHAREMRRPSPPQVRRIGAEARRAYDDVAADLQRAVP